MRESELVSLILAEASKRGHRLFQNPVGVARYKRGGRDYVVHYGVGGNNAPDLWGWANDGIASLQEVKVPGQKPRVGQLRWMKAGKKACPVLRIGWVDSIEGAMRLLAGAEPHPETMYVGPE